MVNVKILNCELTAYYSKYKTNEDNFPYHLRYDEKVCKLLWLFFHKFFIFRMSK